MSVEPVGPPEVEIVEAGQARVDEIGPLWRAMHEAEAEAEAADEAPPTLPFRAAEDAWERSRRELEGWLAAGEGTLLIAEREGIAVGFAFVRMRDGDRRFETGERVGRLEALSVEPELRRWGVGSLLMEEVEDRLAAAGIEFIELAVIAGNDDALRFYRRWGMVPAQIRCLGRTFARGSGPA